MDNNGLGKKILIGIRYYNLKDELVEQFQTSGIIDSITSDEIRIKRENKMIYLLFQMMIVLLLKQNQENIEKEKVEKLL